MVIRTNGGHDSIVVGPGVPPRLTLISTEGDDTIDAGRGDDIVLATWNGRTDANDTVDGGTEPTGSPGAGATTWSTAARGSRPDHRGRRGRRDPRR